MDNVSDLSNLFDVFKSFVSVIPTPYLAIATLLFGAICVRGILSVIRG